MHPVLCIGRRDDMYKTSSGSHMPSLNRTCALPYVCKPALRSKHTLDWEEGWANLCPGRVHGIGWHCKGAKNAGHATNRNKSSSVASTGHVLALCNKWTFDVALPLLACGESPPANVISRPIKSKWRPPFSQIHFTRILGTKRICWLVERLRIPSRTQPVACRVVVRILPTFGYIADIR